MSIKWFNGVYGRPSHQLTLCKLISSFLEPIDPSQAITEAFYLADLLILSNHIDKAHELITALYKYKNEILPLSATSHYGSTDALQYFWHVHRATLARPKDEEQFESRLKHKSTTLDEYLAKEQWRKYRECCRTGWMLEHCSLPEPEDPHIWRKTDDPAMLAMCSRLLAKDKTEGAYPPQEQMREALAAAMKLYAQPQVPIEEWVYDRSTQNFKKRHSYLLYRRLVVDLAIRVGELNTAAEVLSKWLVLDGLGGSNGGSLHDCLFVAGIYDVLPLLAKGGKESNPFFINQDEAETLVKEITSTLELRAKEGRQWSLAPEKVGWKELLDRLAEAAWKVNSKEYIGMGVKCAVDILYPPASEEEIEAAEEKVGELPQDFKEMIKISNGIRGGWHFLGGGIAGIQNIYLSDEPLDLYDIDFYEKGFRQDGDISGKMIALQAGSECDAFYHYIFPPAMWKDNVVEREVKDGEYQYWRSCSWQGTHSWDSIRDWVASSVEEAEDMAERGDREDDDYED